METVLTRQSIYELLKERARTVPDLPALTQGEITWSYADLDRISDVYAKRLIGAGAGNGTSIAVITHLSRDNVALLYGALKIGARITLIASSTVEKTLEYMLDCADADFVVLAAPDMRGVFKGHRKVYSLDGTQFPSLPDAEEIKDEQCEMICASADVDVSGIVLFTSGTTSMPKGVPLTQYRLINNANSHRTFFEADEKDRFVASLPLEHILGVIVTILTPMMACACMCITKDIHTDSILTVIEQKHCTIICGVPSMFHALVSREDFDRYDVSSLRFGLTGGAACSDALFREVEEKLGIILISTLGQTETTGGFTMLDRRESTIERWHSVGVPGYHVEVKILGGEICVRGYQVCDGYLKKPEATAQLIDADGWLHTGDLGRFDEKGILYVTGRRKSIIIRSGENISANQVAGILEDMDGVGECKVFGVPDEHRGEEVCACILRDDASLTREQVETFAKEHMECFKVPRYILFYEKFPRTDVGKVRMQDLKEDALRRIAADS